jgi:hypothetical protein
LTARTKASISNVKTNLGEIQTLNFDLQKSAAAKPFAKGKHYVWIPNITGSHLGMWVEVSDDGKTMSTGCKSEFGTKAMILSSNSLTSILHL